MRCDTSLVTQTEFNQRFATFLEIHRETSLWYVRADYVPQTPDEQLRILQAIQRRVGGQRDPRECGSMSI